MELLAGDAALVQQREQLRHPGLTLEKNHLTLTGDADNRARHSWRRFANDRSVAGRIGAGERPTGRAGIDRDPFLLRKFDGLRVQDLRPGLRHLLRFLVRQRADPSRRPHDTRIGGVHAIDVRADFAVLGVERGCHRDGGGIAASTAKRRDFLLV